MSGANEIYTGMVFQIGPFVSFSIDPSPSGSMDQDDTKRSLFLPFICLNVVLQPGEFLFTVWFGPVESSIYIGIIILVLAGVENQKMDRSGVKGIVKLPAVSR